MTQNERLNADGLICSADYAGTMNEVVLPYLEAHGRKTTVKGYQDRPLACVQYTAEQPRGTVLVLHGFTENAFKFSEISHSLLLNGYSVLAYDQRGHGFSWRSQTEDYSLTHVDDFQEYVRDLEIVCDRLLKGMPKPWYLFSHSMGGAVSAFYLEAHDGVFRKAAFCAPMIAPNMGMPLPAAAVLLNGVKLLGKGKKRAFVSKPYSGPEDFDTSCATSRERFDWYDGIKAAHREYWNNGPTYGWTLEAMNVTKELLKPGAPEKITIPVRLYTAEVDSSVLPGPQEAFIARVKNGKRALVKGSRHEIYRSTDAVLFPWWHEILEFFNQ